MPDDQLETVARNYNIPPYSRTGSKLEHWYVDRVRIIDELLKRDDPEPAAPTYQITEGNMYGSSIQQGTDRSSVVIDYGAKQVDDP